MINLEAIHELGPEAGYAMRLTIDTDKSLLNHAVHDAFGGFQFDNIQHPDLRQMSVPQLWSLHCQIMAMVVDVQAGAAMGQTFSEFLYEQQNLSEYAIQGVFMWSTAENEAAAYDPNRQILFLAAGGQHWFLDLYN